MATFILWLCLYLLGCAPAYDLATKRMAQSGDLIADVPHIEEAKKVVIYACTVFSWIYIAFCLFLLFIANITGFFSGLDDDHHTPI